MYLTSIWRILLMTDGLNAVWSNDRAGPTDTNLKNLELASPQSVTATRLDELVYSPKYYIQIFRLNLLPAVRIEPSTARSKFKVQCAYRLRYGSYLPMCGGGVRSILLLPLVARCLVTIDVCIWCMCVFMSVVVTVGVCGDGCCVAAIVKDSIFIALECWSMLFVCVRDVMDVVFSVCIVMRGAVGIFIFNLNKKSSHEKKRVLVYECFVIQMLYVCVLCASCGSSQCWILHDLQFVNADRGCKRQPYGRGILQSRSHDCLIGNHECLLSSVYPILLLWVFLSFVAACQLVLRCCEYVCCMWIFGLR